MTGEKPPSEHLPVRPTWDCVACANPWPCAIAKETMLSEFRQYPSVLAIYMSSRFTDAFEDLTASGAQAPPDLYDRFLCWIVTTPRALPEDKWELEAGHGDSTQGEADQAGRSPTEGDGETDQQSHEGRQRTDRLPRQGRGRPPSDPTARPAEPSQDKPRRGGGSPPTRSDPSHGGQHRSRCGPSTRAHRHLDL